MSFPLRELPKRINEMVTAGGGGSSPIADYASGVAMSYGRGVTDAAVQRKRPDKTLYMSEIGTPCARKLYYRYHFPELGQRDNDGPTRIKFMYGDFLEHMVLQLAQDAGYTVTEKQGEAQQFYGDFTIRGRIDAEINGVTVDVKSVTKYSEEKFKDLSKDDPFGYYDQLNGYAVLRNTKEAGFLTIQKELGHIKYWPIKVDVKRHEAAVKRAIDTVTKVNGLEYLGRVPAKPMSATSPNLKLDVKCSYCEFKKDCWSDANDGKGLRTFLYSTGPVSLVKVVKEPDVMELSS